MILRILFLVCAAILSPSLGKLNNKKFNEKYENLCFQNEESDPFRINGQDTPLSNTLENFIAMAEKLEVANPSIILKDELAFFISEFVFENLEIKKGSISQWKITRADSLDKVESMWDPENHGYKSESASTVNPFLDNEKCSLYYMISHSLLKKDVELLESSSSYGPRNYSFESGRAYSDEIHPDDYFPQELGVVAIRGTDSAVSLSKVLIGLYVALNEEGVKDLTAEGIQLENLPQEIIPQKPQVEPLYATTLAGVLMQSRWSANERSGLAPNGKWVSIPLGKDKPISGFCPMVYKQEPPKKELPAYSYSSVRGAADGIILGSSIPSIFGKKRDVKLSQILRMYYSPDGISLESPLEDFNTDHVSFCQRQDLIRSVEGKLIDQMKSYGILVADVATDAATAFKNAKSDYERERNNIYDSSNTDIRNYCNRPVSVEKPEDLPKETLLDVIVVLDSSNSENAFQEQQLIVGHLAKQLDLRYTGSRMTVLLDQKISSGSSTSSIIELKSVVNDTHNSACAACIVGQIAYEPSTMEEDEVIVAIDQLLAEKKKNDTSKSGVNGKVVVYFNYASENGRTDNNKIQGNLEKALREMHLRHLDVNFYAVGLDPESLKKFVKKDANLVFLGSSGPPEEVAKEIFKKLSFVPALLQYADCEVANNENAAVYENFVSPLTIQHYEMPAEYFYKSFKLSVRFEAPNGYIKVCHNRATPTPENVEAFCKNTSSNTGIEFKLSNPCKSFTKVTCSPFYFSIMGMNSVTDMRQQDRKRELCNNMNDHWCSNLHQIKYKVTHSGIRCSGCLGLTAPPAVILLALLPFIVLKRF